jgi:hypothetical protein
VPPQEATEHAKDAVARAVEEAKSFSLSLAERSADKRPESTLSSEALKAKRSKVS